MIVNSTIIIEDALFCPEFRLSLISISQLTEKGLTTTFTNDTCVVYKDRKVKLTRTMHDGLYFVDPITRTKKTLENNSCGYLNTEAKIMEIIPPKSDRKKKPTDYHIWHRRTGHLNCISVKNLLLPASIDIKLPSESNNYDICIKAKHRQRFK